MASNMHKKENGKITLIYSALFEGKNAKQGLKLTGCLFGTLTFSILVSVMPKRISWRVGMKHQVKLKQDYAD
jgi:hypothetical protein